ncbi:hypothetical protein LEN26_015755 [Aphanomyces euteiches]|nr:hypothetical protein LEN26_015755 [Aphanomyces euteiches]KAH9126409.1 hypothetical protein AeMF1_003160 [Aphanomyces euteiches]KAH9190589.1 hypothetical protein AeNC1_007439 [Aphanomyces euteiches]
MKVVIDTDGGLDDALAILMAVNMLPPKTVVAITTVFGNVHVHQATHNVSKVLEVSADPSIPVYPGASGPLISSLAIDAWDGHGPDGLGGAAGIVNDLGPQPNEAVPALVKYASMYPGELVIITIGPATNLALAAKSDPLFASNIARVLHMGCTIRGEGNTTPHAEFNTACDPEACQSMLDMFAGKLTVVGWECTVEHGLSWEIYHDLVSAETRTAAFVRQICSAYESHAPHVPFILCDAYTVMLLVEPQYVLETKLATCKVNLEGGPMRGACEWTPEDKLDRAIQVVWRMDTARFVHVLRRLVDEKCIS